MPMYIVKVRRLLEWENAFEAPDAGVAEDIAKLEARYGTIVDDQVIVEEVQPAGVAD